MHDIGKYVVQLGKSSNWQCIAQKCHITKMPSELSTMQCLLHSLIAKHGLQQL